MDHSFAWVRSWQDNSGVKSHVFLIFVSILCSFFFAFQSLIDLHFIMSPWPARHMFLFFFLVRMLSSIWGISHWYMMLVWFLVLFTHALSSGSDVIDYAWQINDYFTNNSFGSQQPTGSTRRSATSWYLKLEVNLKAKDTCNCWK